MTFGGKASRRPRRATRAGLPRQLDAQPSQKGLHDLLRQDGGRGPHLLHGRLPVEGLERAAVYGWRWTHHQPIEQSRLLLGMRMLLAPSLTGLLVDPLPAFRLPATPLAASASGMWQIPASAISAMQLSRHCCLHRGYPMVPGGQASARGGAGLRRKGEGRAKVVGEVQLVRPMVPKAGWWVVFGEQPWGTCRERQGASKANPALAGLD